MCNWAKAQHSASSLAQDNRLSSIPAGFVLVDLTSTRENLVALAARLLAAPLLLTALCHARRFLQKSLRVFTGFIARRFHVWPLHDRPLDRLPPRFFLRLPPCRMIPFAIRIASPSLRPLRNSESATCAHCLLRFALLAFFVCLSASCADHGICGAKEKRPRRFSRLEPFRITPAFAGTRIRALT